MLDPFLMMLALGVIAGLASRWLPCKPFAALALTALPPLGFVLTQLSVRATAVLLGACTMLVSTPLALGYAFHCWHRSSRGRLPWVVAGIAALETLVLASILLLRVLRGRSRRATLCAFGWPENEPAPAPATVPPR